VKGRILQCQIHNLPDPPSPLIESCLREASFWHVALVGQGCKLDPKLISALVERWRPDTHTFHPPCGESTITLEDVHLQLGLLVDKSVVTGSVQSTNWGVICLDILGAVLETIYKGQIEMAWIRKNFVKLFELTSYEDLAIQAVVPEEFFVNPNAWNVKVPLVLYATVDIHETDR
ncbi:hypothetical protein Goari_003107, partial [Gossypium aridum]|nr:hypothetical protein [Gossypium aridum]